MNLLTVSVAFFGLAREGNFRDISSVAKGRRQGVFYMSYFAVFQPRNVHKFSFKGIAQTRKMLYLCSGIPYKVARVSEEGLPKAIINIINKTY